MDRENNKLTEKSPAVSGAGKDPRGLYGRAYSRLASISTSLYLLGITAFFYTLGTIFPQGGDLGEYAEAGGSFVFFVKIFSLLELFSSPLFLIAAFLLFLNLLVCVYDRYFALRTPEPMPDDFSPDHTFLLTQDMIDAKIEVRRVFREDLGFTLLSKGRTWVAMEKGPPRRFLTWLYHLGIAVCFIGFTLTYLFAYEGTTTLWPGSPDTIEPETGGRAQRLLKRPPRETSWSLVLDGFSTEYVEKPDLDYPEDKISRLAVGLGWMAPRYEMRGGLAAGGWRSELRVIADNRTVLSKTMEVNDPLEYGWYTFYQIAFEQRLKVRIDGSPIPVEAETDTEVFIPGVTPTLKFKTLRTGTLNRLDGTVEEIIPYTTVSRAVEIAGKKDFVDIGRLSLDGTLAIDGRDITIAGVSEGSTLSYRFDPGVPVLWWSGIFVLIVMCVRFYGSWYLAAYSLDEIDGIVKLRVHISTGGVLADRGKLAKRLEYFLTKDDLRPTPLD
jgi:hypothetical protein